jgi:hypothetical protein
MVNRAPRQTSSEGGAGERYCVLCEEDGKPNEIARNMVTIRPKSGGEPRRVAICLVHVDGLGKPESAYKVVAEPTKAVQPKNSARAGKQSQGKSQRGDINRTLRQTERYGKTQRGRLGE